VTSFEYASGVRDLCARRSSASSAWSSAVRHASRPSRYSRRSLIDGDRV